MTHDRRWAYLPLVVTGFLLQHATQGWCPPVPILRALGFRTQGEIERERYALKALRGDFDDLPGNSRSDQRRAEQHSTQHTDGSVRLSGSYQRRDPSFDTHGEGYDQGRRKGGEIHVGSIPRPGSDNLSHGKFKSAPL